MRPRACCWQAVVSFFTPGTCGQLLHAHLCFPLLATTTGPAYLTPPSSLPLATTHPCSPTLFASSQGRVFADLSGGAVASEDLVRGAGGKGSGNTGPGGWMDGLLGANCIGIPACTCGMPCTAPLCPSSPGFTSGDILLPAPPSPANVASGDVLLPSAPTPCPSPGVQPRGGGRGAGRGGGAPPPGALLRWLCPQALFNAAVRGDWVHRRAAPSPPQPLLHPPPGHPAHA